MSREIKFRAWNKEEKVMVDDINLLSSSKSSQAWIGDIGEGGYFNPKAENYVVMQFTGLKDKNGKEIYEGDIFDDGSVCEFIGGKYVKVERREKNHFVEELKEDLMGYPQDEVIGNIYENPELLKGESL